MSQTTNALRVAAGAEGDAPKDFPTMLKAWLPEIQRALPKHMDGDRMARIALTEFRKNPLLGKCAPKSVFAAIVVASQLGLEPGVMGQCYLVPYFNDKKSRYECQLIPGWQGLADLATRTGRASVWTGAVFKGDEFEWGLGDRPFIQHKRGDEDESEANLTHVYAVGRVKGAEWPIIEVWTKAKVERHLKKYNKQGDKHYALHGNLEMYGRKVALLQVLKYMPKSPEVAAVVDLNGAGSQNLELVKNEKGVIEGTWAVEPDDDETQGDQGGDKAPRGDGPTSAAAAPDEPQRVKPSAGLE